MPAKYQLWERFKNGKERPLPHYGRFTLNSSKEPVPTRIRKRKLDTRFSNYPEYAVDPWAFSVPDYSDRGIIELSEERRARLFWRIVPDPRWRDREDSRLADGTYIPLPWTLDPIPDHYAHVAIGDSNMIAFTENEEKGQADRQTRMKPGRYLTRFYPDLDAETVRAMAVALDNSMSVKFATTPDEIERVYKFGPNSCMAGETRDFASPVHPTRVYAAGDLAVAYLSALDLDSPGFKASARAVVWPEKKLYGRMYGDEGRLGNALRAKGYKHGDFLGARLLRITHEGGFVCPYLDGIQYVKDYGDHLRIERGRDSINADSTDGMIGGFGAVECENCGARVDDVSTVRVSRHDHESWCDDCTSNTFWCYGYNERCADSCEQEEVRITRRMAYGGPRTYTQTYSLMWCEDHFTFDDVNECWVDEPTVTAVDTEETTTLAYAREHWFQVADTLEWFAEKEPTDLDGKPRRLIEKPDPAQASLPLGEAQLVEFGDPPMRGRMLGPCRCGCDPNGTNPNVVVACDNAMGSGTEYGYPDVPRARLVRREYLHPVTPPAAPVADDGPPRVGDTVRFTRGEFPGDHVVAERRGEYIYLCRPNGTINGGWHPSRFTVVRHAEPNATTLPGGWVREEIAF